MTPGLRLALAVASFLAGAYLLVTNEYTGVVFLGGAAYFGYSYFKYGTVWLAFREVAHGRMDAAAKLLAQVKNPEALGSEQRAYFELASGLVCASKAQNQAAEQHLQSALAHELRTDNDRAMAEAVLAQLLVDPRRARRIATDTITSYSLGQAIPLIAATTPEVFGLADPAVG